MNPTLTLTGPAEATVNQSFTLIAMLVNNSTPLTGVPITFQRAGDGGLATVGTATTASDGSATFTSIESDVGTVTFQAVATVGASRYASDPLSVSIVPVKAAADDAANATVAQKPTLTLSAPSTAVVGAPIVLTAALVNHDGSPVSGQPVSVSSVDGSTSEGTATTGPGGSAPLTVTENTPGTYTYEASTSVNGTELASNPVSVVFIDPYGYDVTIIAPMVIYEGTTFSIKVTVTNSTYKLPAQGIQVLFHPRNGGDDNPSTDSTLTTGPDGVATMTYTTTGQYDHTYDVTVTNPGPPPQEITKQRITVDVDRTTVVHVLASYTYTPLAPYAGQTVTFDGSGSTGTNLQYRWWSSGPGGGYWGDWSSSPMITHSFSAGPPNPTVRLYVKDGSGNTDNTDQQITVVDAQAAYTYTPISPLIGQRSLSMPPVP